MCYLEIMGSDLLDGDIECHVYSFTCPKVLVGLICGFDLSTYFLMISYL